eukprot:2314865-Rhodomonas_salina.1
MLLRTGSIKLSRAARLESIWTRHGPRAIKVRVGRERADHAHGDWRHVSLLCEPLGQHREGTRREAQSQSERERSHLTPSPAAAVQGGRTLSLIHI